MSAFGSVKKYFSKVLAWEIVYIVLAYANIACFEVQRGNLIKYKASPQRFIIFYCPSFSCLKSLPFPWLSNIMIAEVRNHAILSF